MTTPIVRAAALANVTVPPDVATAASASSKPVPAHTRSAYVGLPGPANTERAVRTAVSARSSAAPSRRVRQTSGATVRPTLRPKYATAFSVMSSAFSWKP